jgi:hypothetical protein
VRDEVGTPVRWGKPLPPQAAELRREYLEMLHKTLIETFRPEIPALQVPLPRRIAYQRLIWQRRTHV